MAVVGRPDECLPENLQRAVRARKYKAYREPRGEPLQMGPARRSVCDYSPSQREMMLRCISEVPE